MILSNNDNLSYQQKAATIETSNGNSLTDARGYLADTLKIVMETINATGVLKITTGGGSQDATGTWNGVIGVVVRDVS